MSSHQPLELPSHEFLAQLARDDPAGYEDLRRALVESLIDSAPDEIRPRLRGLQFRIDGVRRLSKSALGSTMKVYALMWESFYRLNDEMAEFGRTRSSGSGSRSAEVIPLRPRVV